jgi:hypothetical protein
MVRRRPSGAVSNHEPSFETRAKRRAPQDEAGVDQCPLWVFFIASSASGVAVP